MPLSEYEQRRLKNLAENRRILGELGALNDAPAPMRSKMPTVVKKRQSLMSNGSKKDRRLSSKPKPASSATEAADQEVDDAALARRLAAEADDCGPRRSSRRLEGRPAPRYIGQCDGYGKDDSGEENWLPPTGSRGRRGGSDDEDDYDDDDEYDSDEVDSDGEGGFRRRPRRSGPTSSVFDRPKVAKNRPNVYGAIPGVAVGTLFETRIDACLAGLHRPTVAGIHGGTDGAYSIALSGGYEDDIDLGSHFTYTGEGGRDLKGTKANPKNLRTAPQTKDQALTRNNAALVKSAENGQPVRVIRGYKLRSEFAPPEGYYRYDGLYRVEKWWYTTGMAGFGVYKFAFKRLADQAPAPWEESAAEPVVYNFRTDYRPPEEEPVVASESAEKSVDEELTSKMNVEKGKGGVEKKKSDSASATSQEAASKRSPVELDYEAVISGQIDVPGKASCHADGDEPKVEPKSLPSNQTDQPEKTKPRIRKSKLADSSAKQSSNKPADKEKADQDPAKHEDVENLAPTLIDNRKRRGRKPKSLSADQVAPVEKSLLPPPPPPLPQHQQQQPESPAVQESSVLSPPRKRSRFYFEDC